MCGIAGCMSTEESPVDGHVVEAMLASLVHRGPDDEGTLRVGRAVLGARRLSIIDLEGGHQPVSNEDGSVIVVQNGEIYNYRSLRERLVALGHHFRSRSDTEVLPHAYEQWDVDFINELRGMFALALWDHTRNRLVLARDRLGKKPLVYGWDGQTFLFASELQALMRAGIQPDIDDEAISQYLAFGYVPAPLTAYKGVRKVQPGHIVVIENGSVVERRYWSPRYEPKQRISFMEAAASFRAKFDEAVRLRLESDVPIGVLLSGGLDSSAVVESAARQSSTRLKTFSIGFREADFDELRYARLVAERFETDHHEFIVDIDASSVLPQLVRHFGEPFADSSAIPTYWVARTAREHVTVALNGDGGDELFGGYVRYRGVALAGYVDRIPGLASILASAGEKLPSQLSRRRNLGRAIRFLRAASRDPLERYYRWVGYFTGERRLATLADRYARNSYTGAIADAADVAGASDPVERMMAADLSGYLPGDLLPKMDIATMANSLETRSPFLDHELVSFVGTLPREYKVSPRASKILMRSALKGVLPQAILTRDKMGFGVPVGLWLRSELRGLLEDALLPEAAHIRTYVKGSAIRQLVVDHIERRADHTPLLWCLLMLELWFRECVVGSTAVRTVAARPRVKAN
jgi:asparagine synthase (glutamine-hydrolysing)